MDVEIYVVGNTIEQAKAGFMFDDPGVASEYALDNGFTNVYSVTAEINWATAESVWTPEGSDI